MTNMKKLILNADDYGACEEVNAAIEELALAGMLGGVSVLANGASWEAAADFLRAHPHVSAGIHLNVIEGLPVAGANATMVNRQGELAGRNAMMLRWVLQPRTVATAVEREWRAQIERLLQAGLRLTHADSHQHFHAFPPAFRLAVKLCQEYRIPALRWPGEHNDLKTRRLLTLALNANLAVSRPMLAQSPLRTNDHFLGFKRAGEYGLTELLADVATLRPGITEIALHPSLRNYSPYAALRGDDERRAVLSPEFRAQLVQHEIQLTQWHTE